MYAQPTTLEEAVRLAQNATARIVMGGTDFFPALGDGVPAGDIIDLSRVRGLRDLSMDTDAVHIGAGVTWSDILKADLPPAFDGLKEAGREVGSVQIQNAGSVVGNICNASPAADGVPPLLTLGAHVQIAGPEGARDLPVQVFIQGPRQTQLGPGEIVTGLRVPRPDDAAAASFLKLGSRKYLVISIAMVAVCLRQVAGHMADVRIAVGACSPVARRLGALEDRLSGQPVGILDAPDLVAPSDLAPLSPIDDVRGSAEYRGEAVGTLVRRALQRAVRRAVR